MAELEFGQILGVGFQEPRVIDHREKDQRLARGQHIPRPAYDLARGQPRARRTQHVARRRPAIALPTLALPARLLAEPPALPALPTFTGRRRKQCANALVEVL